MKPGFVWVIDPSHGDDDFFTVKDIKSFNDRDRDRVTEIVKRIYQIEFHKEGKYDLRFLKVHNQWLEQLMQVGALSQTFIDKKVIDDMIVLPVQIAKEI